MRRHDAQPEAVTTTWADFLAMFATVRPTEIAKKNLPAWVPAKLDATQQRRAANTIEVTALVLDVDHATREQRDQIFYNLNACGLEYCYHSTYSYDPLSPPVMDPKRGVLVAEFNYRVIVQLSRSVPAQQWRAFRAACVATFAPGAVVDSKTQDPCRLYYLPACPADGPPPDAGHVPGRPLDVDLVLHNLPSQSTSQTAHAMPAQRADLADLRRLIPRRIDAITNAHARLACETLANLLDGKTYAAEGQRDEALYALSGLLATKFPHATPESLVEPLVVAIDFAYPNDPDAPTSDQLREKIARRQVQVIEELRGEDPIRLEQIGRHGPYNATEIETFLSEHHLASAEHLARQLIVNHKGDLYVFYNGEYVHAGSKDTASEAIRDRLRAAVTLPGVMLKQESAKGGFSFKPTTKLLEDYGINVEHVLPRFDLQQSRIDLRDPLNRTLQHAIRPRDARLKPVFSQDVADWLVKFGGDQLEDLLDWIATAPKLERPTAALVIVGDPGSGKDMFAAGLARIWGRPPTKLESLGVNFNGDLTNNPVVFGNESLPWEYRQDTGLLRQLITTTKQKLRRKFMHDTDLIGSIRVIIARNNLRLFDGNRETLSASDIKALDERLLFIGEHRFRTHRISDETMAQHFLWLEQERAVDASDRRLWVQGKDSALHRHMRVTSHNRAKVCQWLMGLVHNPASVADCKAMFRMDQTGLRVQPRLPYERFVVYMGQDERRPSIGDVCAVMSEIGTLKSDGMCLISLDDLAQWGLYNGYQYTVAQLAELISAGGARIQKGLN